MSALSAAGLASIRDEVGTGDPSDQDLRRSYDELGHWILVAVRVLKRRRAESAAGGGVSQVTIPGAVAVTLSKTDLASLDRRIATLEARYAAETGEQVEASATSGRLTRLTPR